MSSDSGGLRGGSLLEDFGTTPVPTSSTRNWFEMGIVIWGVSLCIPAFMLAGFLGTVASFKTGILAIILGAAVLALVASATGAVGGYTRLSTAMSARYTFGRQGNGLMAILLAIGAFGWFGIQLEVFGQAISGAAGILSNDSFSVPAWLIVLVGGVLMSSTALVGFKAIEKLTLFVIPLLLLLMIITMVKIGQTHSFSEVLAKAPEAPASLGVLVSMIAGGMAIGAVVMPDISRYARNRSQAIGGSAFGFMVGFPLVLLLALYLGMAGGNADFTSNMLAFNGGLWGLFAMFTIVFATWTTNDNNLYSAALALNSLFPKMHKWMLTAIVGGIGTLLAAVGILSQFQNWLIVLGVSVPPIGAVMAVDFFLFRWRAYDTEQEENLPDIRWQALGAWALGLIFGLLTYYKVFSFTTAPALDAIIASAVGYAVVMFASGARLSAGAPATRQEPSLTRRSVVESPLD